MKIVLTIQHLPPNYIGGSEIYTLRLAQWLKRRGYGVEVVCVESITSTDTDEIRHTREILDGISVWRLYFNLNAAQNPFRMNYDNPLIGQWFVEFLKQTDPDLVHINSCYLLSINTIMEAKKLSLPVVVTLHDFWFICPRITLLKPTGELCTPPINPVECSWCLATEKRRFRLPDRMTSGAAGCIARRSLSLPSVANLLGIHPDPAEIALRQKVLINALNHADFILSPSEFLRNIFIQQGLNPATILYSRLGLDIGNWIIPGGSSKSTVEELHIGYIGQLAPHKGVHVLIRAFNKLSFKRRKANLKIYGDLDSFTQHTKMLRKIANGNSQIKFAGPFDNRNVAQILADIDITVTPSIWYENSPIAITESLTTGTPVVATNLGGMPELVRHNANGLLFKVGDATDLARQLQRLLDEPGLKDRLAKQAKPVRLIDDEMNHITNIYKQLV